MVRPIQKAIEMRLGMASFYLRFMSINLRCCYHLNAGMMPTNVKLMTALIILHFFIPSLQPMLLYLNHLSVGSLHIYQKWCCFNNAQLRSKGKNFTLFERQNECMTSNCHLVANIFLCQTYVILAIKSNGSVNKSLI